MYTIIAVNVAVKGTGHVTIEVRLSFVSNTLLSYNPTFKENE